MDLELYLGIHDQFTKFEKDFALLILEWSMVLGFAMVPLLVLVHIGNSFKVK